MNGHELYVINERLSRLEGRISMVFWFLAVSTPLIAAAVGWCLQHHIVEAFK